MKIVHLFCDDNIGGAEIYALNLAKEAVSGGDEVSFILGRRGAVSARLDNESIPFSIVPMESSFKPLKVLKSILLLKKKFREDKIDLVHTHMLREHSLTVGAKFLGARIKIVRTFHRLDQFNLKMKPLLWLYRWQTDAFIAVSEMMKDVLLENNFKRKVVVIYNGVPKVEATKHDKAIGYLGRIAPEKGILRFVEENKERLKGSLKLYIAGEGEDLKNLSVLAKEEKLNVELMGFMARVEKFFEKIQVLVLPTEAESTLPLAVIEGFSCGVPVVTFDIKPLSSLIRSEYGLLLPKRDYIGMGEAVEGLLDDDRKLERLSEEAKSEYINNYTIEKMWSKTDTLYKSLFKN